VHSSTVPALLVGGWQDWFLEQTLYQYRVLRDRGVDVGLTVGPWTHLGIDAGVSTAEALGWLGRYLPVRGEPGPARTDRVKVWVTGLERWRGMPDWPPPTTERTWYLTGASYIAGAGLLRDTPPTESASWTSFRYDPMKPTPSVGGRVLSRRAGRRDNTSLELREDVVTFTSAALAEPVELLGAARVRLCLTSDNPYGDVFVRLCDIDTQGTSVNVTDRLVRLDPRPGEEPVSGRQREVEVTLPDTAHRFLAGHQLRLQVSGGAHPRYARNMGTGEPVGRATHGVPVIHRIEHSAASPSSVTLPVG
jgi:putative CocE/NonD family hydrolase